jgi:hypothetical protein
MHVGCVTVASTLTKDIRGRERLALVHALAANDQSADQLAEQFGRTEPTVHQFAMRNRAEIAEARRQMAGEFSGLWIARKEARLAEYQQKYDDIDATLGHLPSRTPGEGPATVMLRHEVVGVDLSAAMFDPRLDPVSP